MQVKHAAVLVMLAAIWGASFLFTRVAVPSLGPAVLILGRVGSAAAALWLFALLLKAEKPKLTDWKHYLTLGLLNSSMPFFLFAFAAQVLSASLLSILNATVPIWGVLISALWLRKAITLKVVAGLVIGLVGVATLVGFDPIMVEEGALLAVIAVLGATFCYALGGAYAQTVKGIPPQTNAHGNLWGATLVITPFAWLMPINEMPTGGVMLSVLALGVICTAVAYFMFFYLVSEIGASSTLTVTFLIPVFGIFWGALFLDEPVGWQTFIGGLLTLTGTSLVTGFSPKQLFSK